MQLESKMTLSFRCVQILQKIQKEYQQLKSIQTVLHELSIDFQNPPSRPTLRRQVYQESPSSNVNPAAFFQADRDDCYNMPMPGRDPDVFGDPIEPKYYHGKLVKLPSLKSPVHFRSKRTSTATKKPVKGQTSARPSIAAKKPELSKQRNSTSSNLRSGTASKKPTTNGVINANPGEEGKEETVKIKEEQEEEKKFEAGNHMEVDLVDMLGNCLTEILGSALTEQNL